MEWIDRQKRESTDGRVRSPMKNELLENNDLRKCHPIFSQVEDWKKNHGAPGQSESQDQEDQEYR